MTAWVAQVASARFGRPPVLGGLPLDQLCRAEPRTAPGAGRVAEQRTFARSNREYDPGIARQAYWRMLTARATIRPIVTSETSDWRPITLFAVGESGIVSVGLKAAALVSER
jgi:hypothetical protein